MLFWPGLDRWPPSKGTVIAAAILAFVVGPAAMLAGTVGHIVLGVFVVICLALGAQARVRKLNAEEFWRSRPDG